MKYARTSRRRFSRRRPARRYRKATRKISYRKRPTTRPRQMTRKRMLNVVSRKKRDTLRQWTNTTNTGAARTITPGPTFVSGATGGVYIWCPTARDLTDSSGAANTITSSMQRTASTCFMRGLSEKIHFQSSSAVPWKWRRICFTFKDSSILLTGTGATLTYPGYLETSDGYARAWVNAQVNNDAPALTQFQEILFQGRQNVDWNDFNLAKVDTKRVDLKYDKTILIQSGNDNGVFKKFNHWHGMNKNLVYDDDENGDVEQASNFSVTDKRGMGDYIIFDIFSSHLSGTASDILRIQSESTLYWHER